MSTLLPGSELLVKPRLIRQLKHTCGVTMIELICSVSIVAILSVVAVPELGHWRRSASSRAAVNDFFHALYLARSTAIMNNVAISMCRSRDGTSCENQTGQWQDGWIVFQNTDRDQPAERDVDEEILWRHAGWPGGSITSNRVSFSFRPTSQADVTGTVVFCDPHGRPDDARAIIISHAGRPRVSKRDASNNALRCP